MDRLTIRWGDDSSLEAVPGDVIEVGRSVSCRVVVRDTTVSLRHANLEYESGEWWVADNGSTNGTFIDGRQVVRHRIDDGTSVRLGGRDGPELRFSVDRAEPAVQKRGSTNPPVSDDFAGMTITRRGRLRPDSGVARAVRIGRGADCEVRVDDLLASRLHAIVEFSHDGSAAIRDLSSANGTYVDGTPVSGRHDLGRGARIIVGNTTLFFDGTTIRSDVPTTSALVAHGLVTHARGRRDGVRLLDEVDISVPEGQFMCVLGPSGSGKSTLVGALSGSRPASSGTVRFDGADLYGQFRALRHQIGVVPQRDLLHPVLTVRQALSCSAGLRFPEASDADRSARVLQVLHELNLVHQADRRIEELSGGQAKRVSVAMELLARPKLLILDEPTSGLDPGHERSLMQHLRRLADDGHIVVATTHSVQSLDLCDRVLFLAPGGRVAFQGTPAAATKFFGTSDHAETFELLEHSDPATLKENFRAVSGGGELTALGSEAAPRRAERSFRTARRVRSRQLATFLRRQISIMTGDRKALTVLVLQAPLVGLLMLVVFGTGHLRRADHDTESSSANVIMGLVLAMIYLAASNTNRELVKERSIWHRERSVGASRASYLMSKAIVLGAITIAQAAALTFFATLRQGPIDASPIAVSGRLGIFIMVVGTGLSAMWLGLAISSLVDTADKAMTALPVVLLAEFLLSGVAFRIEQGSIASWLSSLSSARWGFGGVAASTRFYQWVDCIERDACMSEWQPSSGAWMHNGVWLVALCFIFAAVTVVSLVRDDPVRRIARAARHDAGHDA